MYAVFVWWCAAGSVKFYFCAEKTSSRMKMKRMKKKKYHPENVDSLNE